MSGVHPRFQIFRGAICLLVFTLALLGLARAEGGQRPLQVKSPLLRTPWTAQVSTARPLPEYPRPQLVRPDWLNLNGPWQFQAAGAGDAVPVRRTLRETVLVPFPVESALSGLARHEAAMWYRRTFTLPAGWAGRRILLHFGAVDTVAAVYINGQRVGTHTGGYDSFSFDVTPHLERGVNEVIVHVLDDTGAGGMPVGKQRLEPSGIFYTASSGIWQTVWLEPVAPTHVSRLTLTPDVPGRALRATVQGTGQGRVHLTARAGGKVVSSVAGVLGQEVRLPVPSAHLWSPDDPFLYTLTVTVEQGGRTVDRVQSYFGMRSIGLQTVNGWTRPVLNGKFVFQIGTLDQGFWPDGLYTAPSDAALKFDLVKHKQLGFNMVRKHIKVEPQRWYYWADKLGLLVWQDMPSMMTEQPVTPGAANEFVRQYRRIIDQHRSSPAIVTWVNQNEGWGQFAQAPLAAAVKRWDPSRLVDNMSGINCCGAHDGGNGDLADWHVYIGPSSPSPSVRRAAVLGEFGGLGLRVPGHEWSPVTSFSYEMQASPGDLNRRYLGLVDSLRPMIANAGLSAAIYTEITDVEGEVNGLLTYDRQVMKVDAPRLRAAHRALIAASGSASTRVAIRPGPVAFQVPGKPTFLLYTADPLQVGSLPAGTSAADVKAATLVAVPGLADPTCASFRSSSDPQSYLRHRESLLHVETDDLNSVGFRQDATFCAERGAAGTGVTLVSYNFRAAAIRRYQGTLWLADRGGDQPWDGGMAYPVDVTWRVVAPPHPSARWFR
ncbi:glycoside hydrolase family 2 [Deinococcus sp. KSM4-11]|uniref:AbfB domain-containing protein n=1 Tax=Deinococcus sp. KSM4-11 TaxID=2568654 RepID=UPI0010A4A75A|nr:AbfB domain-containing protein [Deinococcus sp. KSM4-11]THF84327.1 glycoside hydrolase family 2 [Deinococcus sp. KSM4-11]